ncbi:hypothetical protein ACFWWT_08265 [Streptomyces sp. NPDC058676]|uniref:hypothetical protein n=1 Tax=unclassified Streptomyces TaxID=2593676 RepID=UPI0036592C9F
MMSPAYWQVPRSPGRGARNGPDAALDERAWARRLADVRAGLAQTSTRAERTAVVRPTW